jgi:hypothetical protein
MDTPGDTPGNLAAGQPEQTFFADPALDRAVAMIMTLAAELHVVKDRLRALEVILTRCQVLEDGVLDSYVPDAAERARVDAERTAYVRELMRCVLGAQASKGAPADLAQRFG